MTGFAMRKKFSHSEVGTVKETRKCTWGKRVRADFWNDFASFVCFSADLKSRSQSCWVKFCPWICLFCPSTFPTTDRRRDVDFSNDFKGFLNIFSEGCCWRECENPTENPVIMLKVCFLSGRSWARVEWMEVAPWSPSSCWAVTSFVYIFWIAWQYVVKVPLDVQ